MAEAGMTGRVALVTGAAHRVGKAIALGLARRGYDLVVHYHRAAAEARQTAAEIAALGVQSVAVPADLSSADGPPALFEAALERFGRLDALVNSAAIMERASVLDLSLEDWDRALHTNLRGPFQCSQLAARQMIEQAEGGAIVNIADLSGLEPWAKYPAHSVSKAGLLMLTQVMAKALGPKVRVNAVASGPVIKPPDWDEARWHTVGQHTAMRRTGTPEDVVRAVAFLLENDYVTGETLVVDGGGRLF
jgi:NAD(P)-dependent dehydrogenase (short-subunit alcohol dehydrogenase family)